MKITSRGDIIFHFLHPILDRKPYFNPIPAGLFGKILADWTKSIFPCSSLIVSQLSPNSDGTLGKNLFKELYTLIKQFLQKKSRSNMELLYLSFKFSEILYMDKFHCQRSKSNSKF